MEDKDDYSAARADQILGNLSTAVLLYDDQFRLLYMNHAGEMLFSLSARHACGKSVRDLMTNAEPMMKRMENTLQSGQASTTHGCRLELPSRQALMVDCTVTPLGEDGEFKGVLVELRQVDTQLRIVQEEQLITQQEATRTLLRGLAHEIKNPLGGLRGAAQLLEREIGDESLREYTRIIIGEADRLQNLMNRMLGPNNVPRKRAINIHEVLERVRELVMIEAESGLAIHHNYDPSLPDLHADPDLLVQALLNIVRNAAQAMEGKGKIILRTRIKRNLNIGNRRHRLVARIDVIDNGPGISEEIRNKIFYPMITTRSEGTGLGLGIAQSLINQHQGLIECSSQPGETVFTILLPLETGDE